MRSQMVTTAIVLLVLFGPTASVSSLAQDPGRGTTLVCVRPPGGSLAVAEWTPAQVADYENRLGRDVAEIAVHPATGDCFDPAGLVGGWSPGTSWLCTPQADGTWSGPGWIQAQSQRRDQAPPDPATGQCPVPASPEGAQPSELEQAAATAVHLTELEVAGDYDHLYAWMHPDAQAVVPQAVMEDWYREVFAQRPPVWIMVDDVELKEWIWTATGKVYPSTAEVSFRQRFDNGEETEGVIHLVRDHGVWRWFFGQDWAPAVEQIASIAAT